MDTAEPLQAVFTTVLKGADELEAGAKAADRFAAAEQKAAQQLARSLGPYRQLEQAQRNLNAARELGLNRGAFGQDLQYKADQAQRRVATIEKRNRLENPNAAALQAFLSSRFGGGGSGGGLMPLVGQSIKAVAGQGGIDAVMGLATKLPPHIAAIVAVGVVAVKTAQYLTQLSVESAELTQRFSDMRRASGGSSLDAARSAGLSRYTGVDAAGAARSFNQRITSDPFAMGLAAQMGISNTPGIYGKRNFGQQYQQAIARTAAIRDRDARERTAESLGIGQEVDRYRLLGSSTRKRMDETSRITARVNNPEAERKAAELQAAVANEAQARENMKNAFGQGFGGGATNFLNWLADQENGLADWMTNTNSFFDKFRIGPDKNYGKRSADALAEVDRQSASGGGMSEGMTAQAANTQATNNLTAAFLKYADKVYGGGERAASATPSGLRGANLHRALQSGGLNLGYL